MVELAQLAERVPHLYYAFGPDHGPRAGNADFGVIGIFEDQAGYEAYANNEFHLRFIERYITPFVDRRSAVQYEVPAGADGAALIRAD